MINFNTLPQFIKDRINLMTNETVRNAFISAIDHDWVNAQIAANELVKGIEDGRWTIEDIRSVAKHHNQGG